MTEKEKPVQDSSGAAIVNNTEVLCSPIDDLLSKLKTSQSGLTSENAAMLLKVHGRNEVAKTEKRAAIIKFLLYFKNPLVLILLIAGIISGTLGELSNSIIIFTMVLLSLILTFFQESKAEKAARELKERVAVTAAVIRDGHRLDIKPSEIVPGDIISLSAGDITPADARVVNAKDFFIDQSSLTGESFPVEKTAASLKPESVSGVTEWSNYLFMATSVVTGSATAVVVRTGSSTEYGKLVKRIVERRPETEFEKGLRRFGYMIMEVTFLLVAFVFLIDAVRYGSDRILDSFLFAVALAVGLTPELLPMIMSINLSKGALAMSKKGVIVKRLASIQNFGNMDILCTDKTGTLTENKVTLMLHVDIEGNDDEKVLLYSFLNSYYQTGLKSPLDEAILEHKEVTMEGYQKIDEVPFDFVRRRVSVVTEFNRERFFVTKGAPEEIAKACLYYEDDEKIFDIADAVKRKIEQKYYDLSAEGFRVLTVAYKKVKEEKSTYSINDESDMIFLGFVAFMDPPKTTAKESLQLLKKSGIELKIITGDNELVTRKVCEQLDLAVKGVVLGNDLTRMQDDALARVVEETNIFARVTPAQKDRIINALKSNGHVVGFLGDGINDAPSMRVADVSMSVDNAVDVAKESADIILLHKDLRVLEEGVLEGRKTFGNTMKYIMMGVSSNFGNMFSAAGASIFLNFLPMLPIQILLNNLMYDLSELAIPVDNVDPEYIEKPKKLDISYVRNFMIYFGPISSIFDFLTFYIMLHVFNAWNDAPLFQTAWFIESLCTQTLVIFAIRTRRSPFFKSRPSKFLLLSSLSIVISAILLPLTPIGEWFQFEDPPITFYAFLAVFVITYLALVETLKRRFYKRYAHRLEQAFVPPKMLPQITPTIRLNQNVVALIGLHFENEITTEELIEELKASVKYLVESEQIIHTLQTLRKAGLIEIDWRKSVITRKDAMEDYIKKYSVGELWKATAEDWQTLSSTVKRKHGKLNLEIEKLLKTK